MCEIHVFSDDNWFPDDGLYYFTLLFLSRVRETISETISDYDQTRECGSVVCHLLECLVTHLRNRFFLLKAACEQFKESDSH